MPIPQYLDIALNGHRFRLQPAPADVGSWLLMQMMDTLMRMAERAARQRQPAAEPEPEPEAARIDHGVPEEPQDPTPPQAMSAEVQAMQTALAVNEMLRNLNRKKFREMQALALEQVYHLVDRDGREVPMPVTAEGGRIIDPDLMTDGALVLNLTTKALVFILSPSSGAGADQQK